MKHVTKRLGELLVDCPIKHRANIACPLCNSKFDVGPLSGHLNRLKIPETVAAAYRLGGMKAVADLGDGVAAYRGYVTRARRWTYYDDKRRSPHKRIK